MTDPYLQKIAAGVTQHGWMCQAVFGDTPAEMFTYTVGLTPQGWPELWVATLAPEQATLVLNAVAAHILEHGVPTDHKVTLPDWSVPFRLGPAVPAREAEAFVAESLYENMRVMVRQVLWPDTAGKYPTDRGYDTAQFPQRILAAVLS